MVWPNVDSNEPEWQFQWSGLAPAYIGSRLAVFTGRYSSAVPKTGVAGRVVREFESEDPVVSAGEAENVRFFDVERQCLFNH